MRAFHLHTSEITMWCEQRKYRASDHQNCQHIGPGHTSLPRAAPCRARRGNPAIRSVRLGEPTTQICAFCGKSAPPIRPANARGGTTSDRCARDAPTRWPADRPRGFPLPASGPVRRRGRIQAAVAESYRDATPSGPPRRSPELSNAREFDIACAPSHALPIVVELAAAAETTYIRAPSRGERKGGAAMAAAEQSRQKQPHSRATLAAWLSDFRSQIGIGLIASFFLSKIGSAGFLGFRAARICFPRVLSRKARLRTHRYTSKSRSRVKISPELISPAR